MVAAGPPLVARNFGKQLWGPIWGPSRVRITHVCIAKDPYLLLEMLGSNSGTNLGANSGGQHVVTHVCIAQDPHSLPEILGSNYERVIGPRRTPTRCARELAPRVGPQSWPPELQVSASPDPKSVGRDMGANSGGQLWGSTQNC